MKSTALCVIVALSAAACASSKLDMSTRAPSPDRRVGLRAGWMDAAEAAWNLRRVSTTAPSEQFINRSTPGDFRLINSDLSFVGHYAIQGNFSGYQVWDIAQPSHPTLYTAYVCPGAQSDVSVYRNLMFVSGEAYNGRTDCGTQGVPDTVSKERLRGIRIFDISDIAHPKYLTNVQTCRGSHTHTVVTSPSDSANVYIYVSGTAPVRSPNELAGCSGAQPDEDRNTALFRIEVIQVPVAHPEQARIVSSPRIFQDLTAPASHGETPEDIAAAARVAAEARAKGGFTAMSGARGHGCAHGGGQRRAAGRRPGHLGSDRQSPDPWQQAASRTHPMPRHHRLPGDRPRRRRVRGIRPPPGHPRRGPPTADRRGGRLQLLLLALGDVQQ